MKKNIFIVSFFNICILFISLFLIHGELSSQIYKKSNSQKKKKNIPQFDYRNIRDSISFHKIELAQANLQNLYARQLRVEAEPSQWGCLDVEYKGDLYLYLHLGEKFNDYGETPYCIKMLVTVKTFNDSDPNTPIGEYFDTLVVENLKTISNLNDPYTIDDARYFPEALLKFTPNFYGANGELIDYFRITNITYINTYGFNDIDNNLILDVFYTNKKEIRPFLKNQANGQLETTPFIYSLYPNNKPIVYNQERMYDVINNVKSYSADGFNNELDPIPFRWYINTGCDKDTVYNFQLQVLKLYNVNEDYRNDIPVMTYVNSEPVYEFPRIEAKVDWTKAMTVETGNCIGSNVVGDPACRSYTFNMILTEGSGYYIWRVRPIGNKYPGGIADERNIGPWNTVQEAHNSTVTYSIDALYGNQVEAADINGFRSIFYIQGEQDLNWIHKRIFTENNTLYGTKFYDEITYADNLLNPRQTKTRFDEEDYALAQETIFDYSGRPVVQSLPVPIKENDNNSNYHILPTTGLKYTPNLLVKDSKLFGPNNFDENGNFNNPDPVNGGLVDEYYDGDAVFDPDHLILEPNYDIPSAEGYPYNRILYASDGSGRVTEQSIFGKTFRINNDNTDGSPRTTRTYFTTASDEELVKIFGNEAPASNTVHKIITIDPNQVISVALQDYNGRVIATYFENEQTNFDDASLEVKPLLDNLDNDETIDPINFSDKITELKDMGDGKYVGSKVLTLFQSESVSVSYERNDIELSYIKPCLLSTENQVVSMNTKIEIIDINTGEHKLNLNIVPPYTNTLMLTAGEYEIRRTVTFNTDIERIYQDIYDEVYNNAMADNGDILNIINTYNDLAKTNPVKEYIDDFYHELDLKVTNDPTHWSKIQPDPANGKWYYAYSTSCCGQFLIPIWDCQKCNENWTTENNSTLIPEGKITYETALLERFAGINGLTVGDAEKLKHFYYDAFSPTDDGKKIPIDEVHNGDLDWLIKQMSEDPNYTEQTLCNCWSETLDAIEENLLQYDEEGNIKYNQNGNADLNKEFNFLEHFLNCTGKHYKRMCFRDGDDYSENGQDLGKDWFVNAHECFRDPDQVLSWYSSHILLNEFLNHYGISAAEFDNEDVFGLFDPYNPNISADVKANKTRELFFHYAQNSKRNIRDAFDKNKEKATTDPDYNKDDDKSENMKKSIADAERISNLDMSNWSDKQKKDALKSLLASNCETCKLNETKFRKAIIDFFLNQGYIVRDEYAFYSKDAAGNVIYKDNFYDFDIEQRKNIIEQDKINCLVKTCIDKCESYCDKNIDFWSDIDIKTFVGFLAADFEIVEAKFNGSKYECPTGEGICVLLNESKSRVTHNLSNLTIELNNVKDEIISEVNALYDLNPATEPYDYNQFTSVMDQFTNGTIKQSNWDRLTEKIKKYFPLGNKFCTRIENRTPYKYTGSDNFNEYPYRVYCLDPQLYYCNYPYDACGENTYRGVFLPAHKTIERFLYYYSFNIYGSKFHVHSYRFVWDPDNLTINLETIVHFTGTDEIVTRSHKFFDASSESECSQPVLCLKFAEPQYPETEELTLTRASCYKYAVKNIKNKFFDQIYGCVQSKMKEFNDNYLAQYKPLVKKLINEGLTYGYSQSYYHLTLYYYDRAGNLVKTIAPKGFKEDPSYTRVTATKHSFVTYYQYNTIGQLLEKHCPEFINEDPADVNYLKQNVSRYMYDIWGRLRFSQEPRQYCVSQGKPITVSYILYDDIGRIIETGEALMGYNISESKIKEKNDVKMSTGITWEDLRDYLFEVRQPGNVLPQPNDPLPAGVVPVSKIVTEYSYTRKDNNFANMGSPERKNLLNRITKISRTDDAADPLNKGLVTTYYSYDPHGNVETVYSELPIPESNLPESMAHKMVNTVSYEYNLLNGSIKMVKYNENMNDSYFQKYEYDKDNKITKVYSSRNNELWDADASYKYYLHGPLKRIEIGDDLLQGLDYTYTINGWLKAINGPVHDYIGNTNLLDPGLDGNPGGCVEDHFSMTLNYYKGDFVNSRNNRFCTNNKSLLSINRYYYDLYEYRNLYNGNISSWQSYDVMNGNSGDIYRYDILNRIKMTNLFRGGVNNNQFVWNDNGGSYQSRFTYDPNGNIKTLFRTAEYKENPDCYGIIWQDVPQILDQLTYNYNFDYALSTTNPVRTNKLYSLIEDCNGIEATRTEPANIPILPYPKTENDYVYDESGNLITDKTEGIEKIDWTFDGKVKKVNYPIEIINGYTTRNRFIEFWYDGMGNRVKKLSYCYDVTDYNHPEFPNEYRMIRDFTYYARGANGKVKAIYNLSNPEGDGYYKDASVDWDELSIELSNFDPFNTNNPDPSGSDYRAIHLNKIIRWWPIGLFEGENSLFKYFYSQLPEISEWHFYGSAAQDRIGVRKTSHNVDYISPNGDNFDGQFQREIRLKYYEIKDHLGDVRLVVRDLRFDRTNYNYGYLPLLITEGVVTIPMKVDIAGIYNYYPFGMLQPGRIFPEERNCALNNKVNYQSFVYEKRFWGDAYRFGYNGKEGDHDLKSDVDFSYNSKIGTGNSYDFGARMYDPRLGRFFSVDPKLKEFESPFASNGNNPIWLIDKNGMDSMFYDQKGNETRRVKCEKDFYFLIHRNGTHTINGQQYYRGASRDSFFGDHELKDQSLFDNIDYYTLNDPKMIMKIVEQTADKNDGWPTIWKESRDKGKYDYKNSVLGKNSDGTKKNVSKTAYLVKVNGEEILFNDHEAGGIIWGAMTHYQGIDDGFTMLSVQVGTFLGEGHFDEAGEQFGIILGMSICEFFMKKSFEKKWKDYQDKQKKYSKEYQKYEESIKTIPIDGFLPF